MNTPPFIYSYFHVTLVCSKPHTWLYDLQVEKCSLQEDPFKCMLNKILAFIDLFIGVHLELTILFNFLYSNFDEMFTFLWCYLKDLLLID